MHKTEKVCLKSNSNSETLIWKFEVRAYKTNPRSTFLQTFVGNDQGQGFRIQFSKKRGASNSKRVIKVEPHSGTFEVRAKKTELRSRSFETFVAND